MATYTPNPLFAETTSMSNTEVRPIFRYRLAGWLILCSAEASSVSNLPFIPASNINLDLSVRIALISDLTHAPLPKFIEEANRQWSAELGWTMVIANRTSMKGILRELKAARVAGRLGGNDRPEE
jgi:hypothetical protein